MTKNSPKKIPTKKSHQNNLVKKSDNHFHHFGFTALIISGVAVVAGFLLHRSGVFQNSIAPPDGGWGQASAEDVRLFSTNRCTIERRYADELSSAEFEKQYRYKKPLILRFKNGADGWTVPSRWTRESLLAEYGRWTIASGTSDGIVRRGGNGDQMSSLTDYLKDVMNNEELKKEPLYMFDRFFFDETKLQETIKPPIYFQIKDGVDDSIFFLGGSGSGVSFHRHADAWNGVIYGRKRWFLYPLQYTPPGGVYPSFSQRDWYNKVYPTLKPDQMPLECIQEAGEIFYLPESYYHGTINIGDTIAIGIQKVKANTKLEGLIYKTHEITQKINKNPSLANKLYEDLEKIYRDLVEALPGNSEALHKLATVLSYRKKNAKAIEVMQQAVELDPWFLIARYNLAKYYLNAGDLDRAEKIMVEALQMHPESFDGNLEYASIVVSKGDHRKAAQIYRKLISRKPDAAFLYFNLANALEDIGDIRGSREALRKGRKLS